MYSMIDNIPRGVFIIFEKEDKDSLKILNHSLWAFIHSLLDIYVRPTQESNMCIAVISTAHPAYELIIIDNRDVTPSFHQFFTIANMAKGVFTPANSACKLVAAPQRSCSRFARPRPPRTGYMDGRDQTGAGSRTNKLPRSISYGTRKSRRDCE